MRDTHVASSAVEVMQVATDGGARGARELYHSPWVQGEREHASLCPFSQCKLKDNMARILHTHADRLYSLSRSHAMHRNGQADRDRLQGRQHATPSPRSAHEARLHPCRHATTWAGEGDTRRRATLTRVSGRKRGLRVSRPTSILRGHLSEHRLATSVRVRVAAAA